MDKERVLVSGGAGYIGSFACKLFLDRGAEIVVIDNLSTGYEWNIDPRAKFIKADLNDFEGLKSAINKEGEFTGLIHFAAKALVGESVSNPDLYYDNNVFGSINLFRAARQQGVKKIIFSSTAATYGEPFKELTEDHPKLPVNPYGNSKLAVERYLQDSSAAYGQRAIALRYFNASGAAEGGKHGEAHIPETHLIPLVVGAGLGIFPPVKVFGTDYPTADGSAVRDYIHVEDLAEAHFMAYKYLDQQQDGFFDAFNLGTGKGNSVLEVIKIASEVLGKEVPHELSARRAGDPAELVAKVDKVNSLIGWKARHTDLKKTIANVVIWMEGNRDLILGKS